MAWYRTGTIAIANGSTTVTGTGTNFIDTAAGVNAGDMLIVGTGTSLRQYEIATVNSATQLTLATAANLAVAAGSAYQIATSINMSNNSLAKKVAAAYDRILQSIANWTTIFSGSGTVTIQNYGESQSYSGLAWPTMSALASAALPQKGRPTAFTDVNNIGPDANGLGIWNFQASADYNMANLPEIYPGVLEVFAAGNNAGTQRYTTARGTVYVRAPSATWNAAAPAWNEWFSVSMSTNSTSLAVDLNTLTQAGRYTISSGAGSANLPISSTGVLEVTRYGASATLVQQLFKTQSVSAAVVNRIFTRVLHNAGNWSAWAESITDQNMVAQIVTPYVTNFGLGLATTPLVAAVDWQQVDFVTGAILAFVFSSSTNQPAGVTYNSGTSVSMHTLQARGNLFVVRLNSLSSTPANRNEYLITISGAKGSRTFIVERILYESNIGTAAGTVAAGDDSRITGALQKAGGTMTGPIAMGGNNVSALGNLVFNAVANGRQSLLNMGVALNTSGLHVPVSTTVAIRIHAATVVVTLDGNGSTIVTFPIAYATVLSCVPVSGNYDAFTGSISLKNLGVSGFSLVCKTATGGNPGAINIQLNYIAMGTITL